MKSGRWPARSGPQAGEEGLHPDRRLRRGGGRPVTEADLEKLGDALLDRLKAESKGGTKKGGKAKEEPDGSGTGEPDSGNGEK